MSLLLCPRCLAWVAARAEACPLCAGSLDPAAADPSLGELADRVGDAAGCVGEVVVSGAARTGLPDRGLLLTTRGPRGGGLFFLPHRPEVVTEPAEPPAPGVGALWTLAGMALGPAALVVPAAARLGFGGGPRRRVVWEPRDAAAPAAVLAEYLMADHGAFFLDRADVRLIRPAGPWPARGWVAECVGRPPVRWRALSDPAGVRAGLRAAGRSGVWHGAVV